MKPSMRRALVRTLVVGVGTLTAASLTVAFLETYLRIPNASATYLVAVVATALVGGTWGAVATAIASFLLYDFFFTDPRFTFTIREPSEWLSVVLLLFIGIVVGQLAALQRSRTEEARAREREAYALFQVSRALATRDSTPAVLPVLCSIVRDQANMARTWIVLESEGRERVAADTGLGGPVAPPPVHTVLRRRPGDEPAEWVLVHQPGATRRAPDGPDMTAYRVKIEAGGRVLGSLWALRGRGQGAPDRTETRLLAAAADQLGGVLSHDQLAAEAQAAEVARQSDELKSSLLQSVSHDLRTPLATIRAAAGTLRPSEGASVEDRTESSDAIEREVEYLNRLVTNLLDLSRIDAGILRADRDVFDLDDLVSRVLERVRQRIGTRPLTVDLETPPVEVDPIFLDGAITNILENAIKYTPPTAPLRIRSSVLPDGRFERLAIEDGGPGVPEEHLPHLFEKFFRVPGTARTSRSGTGIGLAVVKGLVEAMGGRVAARRSELGGLAIDIDLPMASAPPETAPDTAPTAPPDTAPMAAPEPGA